MRLKRNDRKQDQSSVILPHEKTRNYTESDSTQNGTIKSTTKDKETSCRTDPTVPTRRQTISININKATELPVTNSIPAKPKLKKDMNVQQEMPVFVDLTVDENSTRVTNDQCRRVEQNKTKEKAEQCKNEGTSKKQTKAAVKRRKKAVEESFTESSESETPEQSPWQSDSEHDPWRPVPVESDITEESEHESELFESDHEFSAESDDESQIVPTRRARTASNDDGSKIKGKRYACQKCKMHNNPESILLCDNDKCDQGYHCSCLVTMLFAIPEGVWFCPQCQQEKLIKSLENLLKKFDKGLVRQKSLQLDEVKRRKRENFASLNMLPDEPDEDEKVRKKPKRQRATTGRQLRSNVDRDRSNGSSPSSSGSSPTDSDSDNKPVYKLRERGQANVNYRFKDYDDLIKGSDTSENKTKSERKMASDSAPKPTRKTQERYLGKKNRKLNSLDSETEDDGSDDDFRGTSCSEDEQDDNFSPGSGNETDD